MPREEFILKVTRKGEIILEVDGLPPRRIKELVEYFEETLGPMRVIDTGSGPDAESHALDEIVARDYTEDEQQDEPRLRRQP